MPRVTKIILITFFVMMVLFFLFTTIAYYWLNRSMPALSGEQEVTDLADSVTVYRDGTHCPYIVARSNSDLFFMQGYMTAQDRFFQMDCLRHLAEGRLSSLLGASAAPVDSLIQMLMLPKPEDLVDNMTGPCSAMVHAYSLGVNAYIAKFRKRLPVEYQLLGQSPETWDIQDCLALQSLMITLLRAGEWEDVICRDLARVTGSRRVHRLFPEFRYGPGNQMTRQERFADLLDQARRSGYLPLFLSGNQVWAVQGASGKDPLLVSSFPGSFKLPAICYEIFLYSPEIHARGLSIPGFPGIFCGQNRSLAWAVYGGGGMVPDFSNAGGGTGCIELFELITSGSAAQADSLFRKSRQPGLGWVCADTSGNTAGKEPDHSDFLIASWIRERIHELNRENEPLSIMACQHIQTDNRSVLADHLLPGLIPLVIGDQNLKQWADRFISWDHVMRIGDAEAAVFGWWMLHLSEVLFSDEMDETSFSRLMSSPCLWQSAVAACVLGNQEWTDDKRTPGRETMRDCAIRSLNEALQSVEIRQGADAGKWSWGTEHAVMFSHWMMKHESFRMSRIFGLQQPLMLGPYSMQGCYASVAGIYAFRGDSTVIAGGPAARLVMDVRQPDRTLSVLSTGQSGQMLDSHYQDQIPLYTTGYYHPNLFDIEKIRQAGWLKLTVRPEKKQD